jgi:hypothetical protein
MEEDEFNIEDAVCRAFILSLGTSLPSPNTVQNMISWIKIQARKEQEQLSTDYVYSCIPRYINFMFNKS